MKEISKKMINVSYLPLNCENLDYLREKFVTKSSYLVVRCFQKVAKNKQAFTWYQSPIDHNLPLTQPHTTRHIHFFFFSLPKINTLRFNEEKALFNTKRAVVKLPIYVQFPAILLFYYFTLLFAGREGGWGMVG